MVLRGLSIRFRGASRSYDSVRSDIVNCICPDCGGPLSIGLRQFCCHGKCGRDWRPVWESILAAGNPATATHTPDQGHGDWDGHLRKAS